MEPRLDRERSTQLKKQLRAQAKHCFRNALWAVRDVPELHDAWYVEGVVVGAPPRGFCFDHAWVETPDGMILDPTLAIANRWPIAYFPGNRYTFLEAWRLMIETGFIGMVNLGNTPGMIEAREAAWEWRSSRTKGVS